MNTVEMQFDARIENEAFARTVAASFIAPLNPTMDELVEVKTIVSEAIANAIIHGYAKGAQGKIEMRLMTDGHVLKMYICDHGVGIEDIAKARQPLYTTRQDLERSGMGMTIMESLSDVFRITSAPGKGTTIYIEKCLHHGTYDKD